MPVKYNNIALIPAPFVSISISPVRNSLLQTAGTNYSFTLTGTIVNVDTPLDSPGASGSTQMHGILLGQEFIRETFSQDNKLLEISSPENPSDSIRAYASVDNITFNDGTWVNRCDYTVNLTANSIEGDASPSGIESSNENWSVTENEDGTYTIAHQIEAKGRLTYYGGSPNNPLTEAKNYVKSRSFISNSSGLLEAAGNAGRMNLSALIDSLPSGNYWNRFTTEIVDPEENTWQLTENFTYYPSGSVREEWSISSTIDAENPSRATVSVNGSVIGYAAENSDYQNKYYRANSHFRSSVEPNLYLRVSAFAPSGYTVYPYVTNKQITDDFTFGAVRYNSTYNAYWGSPLVSGSIDESINVSDVGPTDVIAQIPVPGRANGPVVQFMHTQTLPERTVSINITMENSSPVTLLTLQSAYGSKPNTNDIIDALKPSAGYFFIKQDSEEWSVLRKQYSRVCSWVIQPEGSGINGQPSGIHNVP